MPPNGYGLGLPKLVQNQRGQVKKRNVYRCWCCFALGLSAQKQQPRNGQRWDGMSQESMASSTAVLRLFDLLLPTPGKTPSSSLRYNCVNEDYCCLCGKGMGENGFIEVRKWRIRTTLWTSSDQKQSCLVSSSTLIHLVESWQILHTKKKVGCERWRLQGNTKNRQGWKWSLLVRNIPWRGPPWFTASGLGCLKTGLGFFQSVSCLRVGLALYCPAGYERQPCWVFPKMISVFWGKKGSRAPQPPRTFDISQTQSSQHEGLGETIPFQGISLKKCKEIFCLECWFDCWESFSSLFLVLQFVRQARDEIASALVQQCKGSYTARMGLLSRDKYLVDDLDRA